MPHTVHLYLESQNEMFLKTLKKFGNKNSLFMK